MRLSCDGERAVTLKKDDLFIRFLKPEHKYKLHILKTAHLDPLSVDLEVTAYRAGDFKESFFVTDGTNEFFVEGLEFSVQTLLPKHPLAPHPPFGPWSEPFPFFYLTLWGFVLFVFVLIAGLKIRFFALRSRFLKKTENRKDSFPAKTFARAARRLSERRTDFIPQLEKSFKLFLENSLFIPAENVSSTHTLRNLKKYRPAVYKKYGDRLRQTLNEFQYFHKKPAEEEARFQMKQTCFHLVFEMDRELSHE